MALRNWIKRLEREAEGEITPLVCEECGEAFTVRESVELELVAHSWAKGYKERGGEVCQETPPDVLAIANHRHGELSFINKSTGERLFASWGA